VKEPGEVDSFTLHADAEVGITQPLKFIYGPHVGGKEKSHYMVLHAGSKYSIYKKYKSDLGYVSSNYTQSELRQFDLIAEYFYTGPDKKMKKLKSNSSDVIKEFKGVKDLSGIAAPEAFSANTDEAFKRMFEYLER
jgi:hypothetical protein